MRIGLSRPRALATLLAGLLTLGSNAASTSSRESSVTYVAPLTNYSCGCSRGFEPHSHIHPLCAFRSNKQSHTEGTNERPDKDKFCAEQASFSYSNSSVLNFLYVTRGLEKTLNKGQMQFEPYAGADMLKVLENTSTVLATASDDLPLDQILIEGLVLKAFIGLFAHEYDTPQSIRFDVTVDIMPLGQKDKNDTDNIVRYDHIVADIKDILAQGHIELVETLAEDVAKACLSYNRAQQVCVTVAKPAAFEDAEAVGIRITRRK